jgi:hypothetical protein
MPDVVNDDEFGALAAEYVLGTLDAPERAHALVLLGSNDGFAAKVKAWERRLGELHLMVEPVEPEWQVWERVRAKIGGFESNPFFGPAVADKIKPEPEQAAPGLLPRAPQLPASLVPGPLESVSPEPASSSPASPPPGSPELGLQEPASLQPVVRGPESEHAAPMSVLSASRDQFPAVAGISAADDVTRWRRSIRQWQALALLMTLVALVLAGFVAALRNFPDRLPAGLRLPVQATAAIPSITAPPARPRAPPESQFDE